MAASSSDFFKKARRKYSTRIGTGGITSASTTIPLQDITGLDTDTGVILVIDAMDSAGNLTPEKEEVVAGVVSGSTIVGCLRGLEGTTPVAHLFNAVVTMYFTESHWDGLVNGILVGHNQDGTHKSLSADLITDGTTNKAYTATEKTKLAAISGTNTGDETTATIKTKLGVTTLSGANTGDQDLSSYATSASVTSGLAGKQATLVSGTNIKTVNGTTLLGSGDITIAGGGGTGDMTKAVYDTNNDGTIDNANNAFQLNAQGASYYLNRTNHTGTQTADTITDGTTNKAYTATEKTKLAAISGTNTGDETTATIKTKLGVTTLSGANTGDQTISDATISTSDITTNNVSITKHGFAPKAPNVATQYLDGTGAWSVPAGGGGGMTNPMTTTGDLIKGGASGAPGRLGIGATGQRLAVVGGTPTWTYGTYFNVRDFGATGNGSTDDKVAIQAAITAALTMTGGMGTVYFPAGTYMISGSLNCTSATGTAGGVGVTLRGDGHSASTIAKSGSGYVAVTWNGNGGPNGHPTTYGGLIDISIEGYATTGGLVQTNSANQMFFRGFSVNGGTDFAMDLNTMQDSSFIQWSSNSVHSASAPIIKVYGSVNGNTNQMFFRDFRIEDFYGTAIALTQGAGSSATNDGFYFDEFKLETGNASGDFMTIDSSYINTHLSHLFGSINSYKAGYSTPISLVTSAAYQSVSYRDIWFGDNIGGQVAALNLTPSGSDFGRATVSNVYYNGSGNTATLKFSSTVSNMAWTITGCGTSGGSPVLTGTLPYNLVKYNNDTLGGGSFSDSITTGGAFTSLNTVSAGAHFGTSGGGSMYIGNNVTTGGTVNDTTKAQWRIAQSQSGDSVRIERSPAGATYTPTTLFTLDNAGKLAIPSVKLGTSSTVGYVWTATDTTGNGSWQVLATGGGGNMSTTTYDPAGIAQQVVGTTATQTLTNKTIDTAGTNVLKVNGNTLAATAGTATVTLPNSTDTLVGRATTDTLTNKTLTGALLTAGSTTVAPLRIPNGTLLTAAVNGAIETDVSDLYFTNSTPTRFKVVMDTKTQTLTNKTLTAPVISTITNTGTLTLPTATDTLVGRTTTDTLTNKTLTAPVISSIVNTGTLTLPTATDTVVARATTDTLTNKTLTSTTNTFATVTTTASSATPTPTGDSRENELYVTALAAGATIAAPTGTPTNGNKLQIRIKDNGTAQTLAFNAIFRAIGVTLPTTTVISKTMYIGAKYNSADSKWDVIAYAIEA